MTHSEAGKLGGRPRLPTLRQRRLSEGQITKEGKDTLSNDIRILRKSFLQGCGSSSLSNSGRGVPASRPEEIRD